MKITVIGTGYLGATHAAAMAELGHDVLGLDVDADQGRPAQRRRGPVLRTGPAGAAAAATSRPAGCASPPPTSEVGRLRRRALRLRRHAAEEGRVRRRPDATSTPRSTSLLPVLRAGSLVVGKSTVPAGTAARLAERDRARPAPTLVWNPEFLREGFAVAGHAAPGPHRDGRSTDEPATQGACARSTRRSWRRARRWCVTDFATAELVKVAANSFLATKISFINAMAEVCEATGADVTQLSEALSLRRADRRPVPARRPRLRRRLPAQGHPRVHGPGRRARRRPGAELPARRSTRSTCAAGPGWSTWPASCATARWPAMRVGRARRGVQAEQRRHPRLAGARRRAADPAGRRGRARVRPAGDGQRPARLPDAGLRRQRRRRPRATPTSCCT